MKKINYLGMAVASLPLVACNKTTLEKPNIVVILADDMGYSDLGCYGGEIETPNLNSLAENGLRWNQFYNNARSCPSRAVLMTGLYPHQAGMGWMAAADLQTPEYQGYLNRNCVTIAEVMRSAGYGTYMTGKWHLSNDRQNQGEVKDGWPIQRGFERFYGIPGGASNYFKATMVNDNEIQTTDDDFYFTTAITDSAATFINRHNYKEKPLFLYLGFTAPHWPLHALQKDIDKYVDRYKAGWDKLRQERFKRQREMGIFNDNALLSPRDSEVEAWDSVPPEQQEEFIMRMAIYAAQIDAMDRGVGEVIKALKKAGQFDNTIIMFMSDNGACAEFISGGQRKAVDGKADTYESYRINWANLSSTPYREYKHFTNEGGIASPLIISWPNGIDKKNNGTFVKEYGYFADIMATCVDISGADYPTEFNGNKIHPMEGTSLVPNFSGKPTGRNTTFWEHEANIAVRDGKWKLVLKTGEGNAYDFGKIELYDMEADPTEMNNLAKTYPDRAAKMLNEWNQWAERVHAFPLDTRFYGERQAAYRRVINGNFKDNFGGWNLKGVQTKNIKYSIDTKMPISGEKTARVDIFKKGTKNNDYWMKWNFPTDVPDNIEIGFTYKSDHNNTLTLRLEDANSPQNKPFSQTLALSKNGGKYNFNHIKLPRKGRWQLVFYFGESEPGSIWIDDVELKFKENRMN